MNINEQIKDLKLIDNCYAGSIELPCWAAYNLPGAKNHNGIVTINLGQPYSDKPHKILEANIKAIAYLIDNAAQQQEAILQTLLLQYPKWQPDYGYSKEDAAHFMPDVKSVEDFKQLIVLSQIHVLPLEKDGVAYIGYEFNTTWDVEHGMGCMYHKHRLIDFGLAESSFMLSIAQSDLDTDAIKQNNNLIFDKVKVQQALYQFTVNGFKDRLISNPEIKDIYALAYDFDVFANMIHLSLNTLQDHEATLAECKSLSYRKNSLATPEGLSALKFAPGNYKHCCFATIQPLSTAEHEQLQALGANKQDEADKEKWQQNRDALTEAVSEIIALYSKGEEVKLLPIVADLYVIAMAHDETLEEAATRIKKYL
jgi:hypothetical protein